MKMSRITNIMIIITRMSIITMITKTTIMITQSRKKLNTCTLKTTIRMMIHFMKQNMKRNISIITMITIINIQIIIIMIINMGNAIIIMRKKKLKKW